MARRTMFVPAFVFVLTLGWIAFIWMFRFIPMEDYPLWLYGGKIFSLFLQGHPVPDFTLLHWPVPNSAFVGLVGLLDLLLPAEISGKIYLSACVILYCLGAYLLAGSLTAKRDSALFLLPMVYVFRRSLWAGELSFSFALGLLLLAMAFALRASRPSLVAIASITIGLFFSHAVPYFCWMIFLFTLAVFDSKRFPRVKTALAVSPSLVLVLLYALHRGSQRRANSGYALMSVLRQTPRFWSLFSPMQFSSPFFVSDPKWLKVAALLFNSCVVMAVLALIGIWFWKLPGWFKSENGSVKAALITPLIFFALFLAFPFEALTGVFDFNYRFLLPAFILILATLIPVLPEVRATRVVAACAVLSVLVFQCYYTAPISKASEKTYALMSQSNLGPDFRDVTCGPFEPLAPTAVSGARLLPVHEAFYTFAAYLRLERQWPSPMFSTGFVVRNTAHSAVLGNADPQMVWPSSIAILGLQRQNREVAKSLPARYRVASDTEYLLILKADGEQDYAKNERSAK